MARALGVERHVELDVDLSAFGGSSLTSDVPVPEGSAIDLESARFRRPTCLRGTPCFCRSRWDGPKCLGASDIFIGVNALDYSGYPDCRPEFIAAFERLASLATAKGCRAVRSAFTRPSRRSPRPRSSEEAGPAARLRPYPQLLRPGSARPPVRPLRQLHTSCGWLCRRPVWQTPYSTDKVRKMRSFWSFSLQRQLAVAIGLLLVPVLAAAVWSGMSTFRERATELGDQARILAHTTAAYINRDLTYLDSTGEGLAIESQRPVTESGACRKTRFAG